MGHSTATVTITAAQADRIREQVRNKPRHRWSVYVETFESRMVDEAISEWNDNEAGRHDSANAGAPHTTPLRTPNTRWTDLNGPDDPVNSGTSVIVPVCEKDQVISKTVKKTVTVLASDVASYRSNGYVNDGIQEAVASQVGDAPIVAVEVVKLPALRKPAAVKAPGKTVTVFDVINPASFDKRPLATEDTEAAARAKALELMNADEKIAQLTLRGRVVRIAEDGTRTGDLTVVRRPSPEKVFIDVKVTTEVPKPGAKVDHYLVAFDYHH